MLQCKKSSPPFFSRKKPSPHIDGPGPGPRYTFIGQNFGGQNIQADKIFGRKSEFRQFCPPKFCPIRYFDPSSQLLYSGAPLVLFAPRAILIKSHPRAKIFVDRGGPWRGDGWQYRDLRQAPYQRAGISRKICDKDILMLCILSIRVECLPLPPGKRERAYNYDQSLHTAASEH